MTKTVSTRDHREILSRCEDSLRALSGARLFVTGGTGFIGTWLLESLQAANRDLGLKATAVVLTRSPDVFARTEPHLASDPCFSFVQGDVKSFAFPSGAFTHVIHAATAASAKVNLEQPFEMFETVVDGTRRVLDFAREAKVRVVLNTSSGGVYGKQPPTLERIEESFAGAPDPMDPWSCYGEAKRMSEMLGMLYSKQAGFEHKIARITALVGPRLPLDIHYAMGNFIRDAMANRDIRILGDGTPYRSYLYIGDLVAWLWTIMTKGRSNIPYNAGSEEPVSILETARLVNQVCGGTGGVTVAQIAPSGQLPSRYVPSTERARAELGLAQWTSLEEGIRRTYAWYKEANL